MFIAIDYIQKTNIILPFSQPKRIVVKNVQYSIFRQFFTHFYFFSLYTTTAPPTLFLPFSFFVAVCLLLCFYSFFPISTPCIFSKHFYTFYVSYVSYFFLCFVTKIQGIQYWTKKLSVFSFEKKKEKNFQKNHIMISNCCVIFTRSSTCVYRHIKNNKERSILSVKSNAVTVSFRIPQNLINLDFLACLFSIFSIVFQNQFQ